MPTSSGRVPLSWPWVLVLLVAIYAAATGSVAFAPESGGVAAWWPAAGLSVILVALSPRRRWPAVVAAILVACTLANLSGGRGVDVSLAFGAGDAAEALLAGALLRRGDRSPTLESFEDLMRIAIAAVVGALAIAAVAPVVVDLLGDGSVWTTARTVYTSHATSVLVIVPAALVTVGRAQLPTWEVPAQVVCLALVTTLVFAPDQTLALTILPLPLLVWGALRLDLRTVTWEIAGFAVIVTYLSARGGGPFGADFEAGEIDAVEMATLVQAYLLCTAIVATPLALGTELRRRLVVRLESSEVLFRRNFTESLLGMLLLRQGSSAFEIVDLNDAAAQIIGGTGSPVGRALGEILETPEPLDLIAARLLAGDLDGWRTQTGLRDRPGARINVSVTLLTSDPEPVFAAQLQDVTAEYDALRQLEAAEKLTSATLDTTAAIILVTDMDGHIVRANAAASELTGYSEAELVDQAVWDLTSSPSEAAGVREFFAAPGGPSGGTRRESIARTRDGAPLRVSWNSSLVRDEHERPAYIVVTGVDVTAERTAAGMNAHLFKAAINTALVGIDTRGRITVFNTGAENLLGFEAPAMVGRPFIELLDPEELQDRGGSLTSDGGLAALVSGIGPAGATAPRDWTWIGRDGRRHVVSMTLSVAADQFAAQVGYLCVGRDVTEARASQDMLVAALDKERLAVERMRQLDEAKDEFISTVSHELRTPVTSIVGYTELLEDGTAGVPPSPEQRPLLESIGRNAQRLIALCNDLLTLGGLDSGATHWARETIDLATILPGAEETVRPLMVGRDLELSLTSGPEPIPVLGDRVQLERALTNLLGNAVKFTEDGGRIECRVERRDDEAWLSVSDTGVGIPAEEQGQLFQRFFRSSTAQDLAIQGTGLGLSIVAAIVAAHGGRIDVRSAHREGTTFTIRLPLMRVRRG